MKKTPIKIVKKEHFQNLVIAALADGDYDEKEMTFFVERAKELGISEDEIDVIMKFKLQDN